jgi:hypothetical protein
MYTGRTEHKGWELRTPALDTVISVVSQKSNIGRILQQGKCRLFGDKIMKHPVFVCMKSMNGYIPVLERRPHFI